MKLTLGLTFFAACASALAINYAWWVTVRIEPQGVMYDEISAEALTIPLKRLTLFNCDGATPTFTPEQCSDVRTYGAHFEVIGDFNGDNKKDIARVGVAELKGGGLVRILLIGPEDKPKQHQIFTLPENGFSALFGDNQLTWYQCMMCGHGADIKWNAEKKEYVLEWGEEYG